MSQQTEKSSVTADNSPRPRVPASPRPDASTSPRRFSVHVAWTLAARVLTMMSSVGVGVIVARLLGAEGLGTLAVLSVVAATVVQLGSGGMPSANTYFIAQNRHHLGAVACNSLIFALIGGGALSLGVLALAWLRPALFGDVPLSLIAVTAVSIPFQLLTLLGLNVFLGLSRIGRFNFLDVLAQSSLLVNAVLALILLRAGLRTLVVLNTATGILMSLLMVWTIHRFLGSEAEQRSLRPDARLFKRMARYGIKFHIALVAGMLIFRADLLLVNHFRGVAEAGVYAVASQAASLLMMLPSVIGMVLMPRVAMEGDARGGFTMRATRHTAFVMLLICLAAIPAAFALPLLYGAPFKDATVQFLILLPGIYLIGVESVLVQHFSGTGLPAAIPLFWLIALATNVVVNLALVPTFGARAAAAASSLCYAMIFFFVAAYFRRQTGNRLTTTFVLRANELRALLATIRYFNMLQKPER